MRSNYKLLGEYIRQVDNRNKDLKVDLLLGVSIKKKFMPSIANIVGTNMRTYKIIEQKQFAYGPVTSRNGDKISVSLLENHDQAIVSQAYTVFEIIDHNKLDPEYLMMWFRRSEFDRYARFKSHGSAREVFDWEEMCKVELPVPSIEKQREIVKEYNIISNRIKLNENLNQKLEETAQTIYKHWFVDFEFPISKEYAEEIGKPELEGKQYKSSGGEMSYCEEFDQEIPRGWEVLNVSKFCKEMKNGSTPKRDISDYWNSNDIPWLKTGEISNNIIFESEEFISRLGYEKSSTKILPPDTILMAMYGATAAQIGYLKFESTTNQACCAMICDNKSKSAYLYYYLLNNQKEIKTFAIGGAQENLSKTLIEKLPIIFSSIVYKNTILSQIIENKTFCYKEMLNLKRMLDLLLAKMTKLS